MKYVNEYVSIGEKVRIEYLEIDEIEILCWLCDYSMLGYMDNVNMFLKLSDKGEKSMVYIKSIEPGTGRIELTRRLL